MRRDCWERAPCYGSGGSLGTAAPGAAHSKPSLARWEHGGAAVPDGDFPSLLGAALHSSRPAMRPGLQRLIFDTFNSS